MTVHKFEIIFRFLHQKRAQKTSRVGEPSRVAVGAFLGVIPFLGAFLVGSRGEGPFPVAAFLGAFLVAFPVA